MKRSKMPSINPFDYYTRSKVIKSIKKYPYNIGNRHHLVTVSFIQIDVYNYVLAQCHDAILEKRFNFMIQGFFLHVDIFIPSKKLVIEVDGKKWHENRTSEDYLRDKALNNRGFDVFRVQEKVWSRISNKERFIKCILNNQISTLEQCKDYLNIELEEVYEQDIISEENDGVHNV